jgi:hypothetical protein
MSYEIFIRSSQPVVGFWGVPVEYRAIQRKRVPNRSMHTHSIGFQLDLRKDFQREASLLGIR